MVTVIVGVITLKSYIPSYIVYYNVKMIWFKDVCWKWKASLWRRV